MGTHRGEELGRRKGLATAWQAAKRRGGGSSVGSRSRKGEQVWDRSEGPRTVCSVSESFGGDSWTLGLLERLPGWS